MELRQMRYAVMVAQHENFRHAADHLPISQSALSQQIQKLEKELGEELFERHSTGVTVTTAGQRFLQKAQGVLERADEARSVVEEAAETVAGTVSVGLMPSVPTGVLTALLEDVDEHGRDVHLDLREGQPEYLLNEVKRGSLDHLIVSGPLEDPDLSVEELLTEPLRIVTPADESSSMEPVLPREDLGDRPLLVLEEGHSYRRRVFSLLDASVTEPTLTLRGSNLHRLLELVEEGHGYTVLPKTITRRYSNRVKVLKFREDPPSRTIVLVKRESRPDSSLDDWFRTQVRQWRDDIQSE